MTHRAESILDAFETVLTGLPATGNNIARARVWPVPTLPAITIYKGVDSASDTDDILPSIVREMVVNIEIHISDQGNPESALHQVASEIYGAIRADYTLGLSYVFDCSIVGDQAPEIEDSQDLPVARMVSEWRVLYEHSKTDTES